MPSLEEAYWNRQPVLLEACRLLQQGVTDSLSDQPDCTCDFRIIELRDLLTFGKSAEAGFDVWRDSPGMVHGTVIAPSTERLKDARSVTEKLFTVHGEQRDAAVYLIPPWAKPAAWSESLALPTHFTIQFLVKPATASDESAEQLSLCQPLTLALSGGGMRAAVYQLGILVYISQLNRLKDVREIVSVSGGSILAAHLLKDWSKALGRPCGFQAVAAEFLKNCRSNIRNRIFVPWVWSWLLPWCWFLRSKGRSGRLRAEYHRIYGSTTLGDLNETGPKFAFVATDGIHHQRIAFTASQILRWSLDQEQDSPPQPILSQGVELSLAVAASSCFPPVFPRLHLTHTDLGITYSEFMQELYLNDGGVVTNLGIEVLIALRKLEWTKGKLILIADAERSLAVMPGNSPLTDVDATLAALGKAAREAAKREFGSNAIPIPFADRVGNKDGLPFRVETAMFNYRTDLDSPTWQEIHGLMIHGAMVAKQATQDRFEPASADALKQTIATIIAEAGGPARLTMPTEADFRHCGTRPLRKVGIHAAVVLLVVVGLCFSIASGAIKIWDSVNSGHKLPIGPPDNEMVEDSKIPDLANSGLQRLTDDDRKKPGYLKTTNRITNQTDRNISLVYSIIPKGMQQKDGLTSYRVNDIPARYEKLENERTSFGGPIFLSVIYDGKWYPATRWIDFGVGSKRDIYIQWDDHSQRFEFNVENSE